MNVYDVSDFLELAEELKNTKAKYIAIKENTNEMILYRYFPTSGKIRGLKRIRCVDIYTLFNYIKKRKH